MERVFSNRITREELQHGDHIYSWRSAYVYAHHGIYVGDEHVIHFTTATGQQGISSSPHSHTDYNCQHCIDAQHKHQTKPDERARAGGVIISCLDCFLSGGNIYRFIYSASLAFFLARGGTCTMVRSDTPGLVIHCALYLLKHGFGVYSHFWNNSEDFAIYCKTGLTATNGIVGCSGQITSGIGRFASITGIAGLFLYKRCAN